MPDPRLLQEVGDLCLPTHSIYGKPSRQVALAAIKIAAHEAQSTYMD
ncbi:hypothetical protein [Chamaesiphon sp. OTE_8_metabat_110]|nr:hypothetical protein [Chamaesiphon sp. OTE_8_metabat_110]